MPTEQTCRLCRKPAKLEVSHIVPSFVFRWQKNTSSTGYMRFGQNINKREQDGIRIPFLCNACESRLCEWETRFAAEVFHPFHQNRKNTASCGAWLSKFCVSISWRVLAYLQERSPDSEFDEKFGDSAKRALSVWADFLLDNRTDIDDCEQRLLPLGPIKKANDKFPENVQRYLMRAIEIDRITTTQSAFTFAKLGRIVIIGFIREPEATQWKGGEVEIGKSVISPSALVLPDWLCLSLFKDRPNRVAQLQTQVSPRQRSKIADTQRKNEQRVNGSETLKALQEDLRLSTKAPLNPPTESGSGGRESQ